MDFYTALVRKSSDSWVSLCLENGVWGKAILPKNLLINSNKLLSHGGKYINHNMRFISVLFLLINLPELLIFEEAEPSNNYELRKVEA